MVHRIVDQMFNQTIFPDMLKIFRTGVAAQDLISDSFSFS